MSTTILSPSLIATLDMKPGIVILVEQSGLSASGCADAISEALVLPALHSYNDIIDAGVLGQGAGMASCIDLVRQRFSVVLLRVQATDVPDAVHIVTQACRQEQSNSGQAPVLGTKLFPAVNGLTAWGLFCLKSVVWQQVDQSWTGISIGKTEASILGMIDPAHWPSLAERVVKNRSAQNSLT